MSTFFSMPKRSLALALAAVAVWWCSDTSAMPMFARKYQTSCTTCHAPFPRLNATGEAFRLNGYKMPGGDEAYIKDEPVSMGAEAYKRVFPKAIWPSDMPGLPPISIRLVADTNIDAGQQGAARTNFEFLHEMELIAAGSLGDRMSFFYELEVDETGTVAASEGWLQLEDILIDQLGENHLNLKVGNLGMQEFALPNGRDSHDRFAKDHYLYTSYRLPGATNRYRIRGVQPGIEVNAFDQSWKAAFGVVNGTASNADNNSEKDVYGTLALKFGGTGYDGSTAGSEETDLGGDPSGFWVDDSVSIGWFGYYGTAEVNGAGAGVRNDYFYRTGLDARCNWHDASIAGGIIFGENSNAYGDSAQTDSSGWYAEGTYWILPWVTPHLRLEGVGIDQKGAHGDGDQTRALIGCNFLLRANVRLFVQGIVNFDNDSTTEDGDADQVSFRLDFAF